MPRGFENSEDVQVWIFALRLLPTTPMRLLAFHCSAEIEIQVVSVFLTTIRGRGSGLGVRALRAESCKNWTVAPRARLPFQQCSRCYIRRLPMKGNWFEWSRANHGR